MAVDITKMEPYASPVSHGAYPQLAVLLLGIGLLFTAWFFVFEVTSNKKTRNLAKELFMASVASLFLGFGTVFLLLWVGIYV
ncbi:hypothetical protein AAVH_01593 [Aphelenchoides avenae]|nr:hypothetical protein AAVH_01593 [Aphelenchus avenae]